MKRYLAFIIIGVVALTTLAGSPLLCQTMQPHRLTISADKTMSGRSTTKSVHIRGNPDASVTLEEFGDFECPPCGHLSEPINQLEHDYRGRVCVIFRNFPLANHKHARDAAQAAEAAGLQDRFWQMHDVLYREQALWSISEDVRSLFKAYAGTIGANVPQFEKDIDSEQVKKRVAADQQQGNTLGVSTTPSIFINDQAVPVAQINPPGLRAAVDAALKQKAQK